MNPITRRTFCAGAGAGLLVLQGCANEPVYTPGSPHDLGHDDLARGGTTGATTGGTTGGTSSGTTGGTTGGSPTGPTPSGGVDGGSASCPSSGSGLVNAGPASAVAVGTPKPIVGIGYAFFVERDAGGLFAVSALCTHSGCPVLQLGQKLVCPCHAATFDVDGSNPTTPAPAPLPHLAVCVDGNGDAIVDTTNFVTPDTRA